MNRKRLPGIGRWPAMITAAAAITLALGGAAQASTAGSASASPSPSPSPSASPAPSASPSPSVSPSPGAPSAVKPLTAGRPGGTCSVGRSGRITDCQGPVAKGKLPPGARNTGVVGQPVADLADLVDTRTWTTGGGNTFPGADVPFGMVQWSPDTLPDRNDGGGYSYTDTTLDGFALTHISGPGCSAAGDVPILPVTGALPSGTDPNDVTTTLTHTNEVAEAGYYSDQSNGPDTITSQFTATTHSSMGRFTFPTTSAGGFDIKLQDAQTPVTADSATIVSDDEISGSETTGDFCGESDNDGQSQLYTVYFDIIFNQPFTTSQVITESGQTDPSAVYVSFDTAATPVVEAKVGISYVSAANAQLDWQTENPGWDFNRVTAQAQSSWNRLLSKITVSGGSYAQTQEFYSLLYKDFLQPNVTSDVNGQFMGADGAVHTLAAGQRSQYGVYSGWDIYHSLSELQAVLDPSAASDQAQSQVNYYSEDSLLQQWGYLNLDNYVMVGDPEDAIIADYYAFGARDFNTGQALADMLKQATTVNDVRPGEALDATDGYLPEDGSYGCCNAHGVVATQLEYDTDDLALSNFAGALGDGSDAASMERLANDWENNFDPDNDLLTARYQNGQFEPGVTPLTEQNNEPDYVEGDAYEYLWDVPNDYQSLFDLLGGDAKVVPELQSYLSQPNGFGMYDEASNEFDLGEQYALDYAGDPAGTQAVINDMESTIWLPGPSGLANNDDLGAESSQYIWEMLGLYPENPGSDTLLLSTPGFAHARIDTANGGAITINAPDAKNEYYAKSLTINGQPDQKLFTTFDDLSRGATLDWTLSPTATSWGSAPQDAPPSYTAGTAATVGYLADQTATVAPGGSTTIKVGADNATGIAQRVTVSVTAPAGVTISPTSATIDVPADGEATATLTVSAGAATTQNFYTAPVTLTTASTGATQALTQTILVAAPGSLLSTFNNEGIASDANPSLADFDGDGNSYSEQALAADGFTAGQDVTENGVTFAWPTPAPGYPDNTVPDGQSVTVNASAGTQQVAFLGSAADGPVSGVVTLNYSDGSTAQYWLGFSDWTLGAGSETPSYGNTEVATTAYRDCSTCSADEQAVDTYLYEAAVPVDPDKTLTSVNLPNGTTDGTEHIFSVGTSSTAMTGPVVTGLTPATAAAGQQVTITGTGFGASQGAGYVAFSDNGTNWGAPANSATLTVDSWSDTSITFTVPEPSGTDGEWSVSAGTPASVTVVDNAGDVSDSGNLEITPTDNPADYYDDTGISADTDTSCADFDGDGYSYSADALAAAGLTPGGAVTADGLTFTWPDVASCDPDNILAAGQTMLVSGTAGASELGLLESSSNGGTSGDVTITYTDGTSSTDPLSSSDWAGGPGPGETEVATMSYRNQETGGSQTITMYVYATTVPIDSSKTVASITFPNVANSVSGSTSAMHIFAVSTG